MSYPDAFTAAPWAGISDFPNLKQEHSAYMQGQHCRACWTTYGCTGGADHSPSSTAHDAVCRSPPLTQNCRSAEPCHWCYPCIWQKAPSTEAFCWEHRGGCEAAAGTVLAQGAPMVPCLGGTNAQLSPDTKLSHRQSRAQERPCELSWHRIRKEVWKSLTRGQKSMKLQRDSVRNFKMLLHCSCREQWLEYQIWNIPSTLYKTMLFVLYWNLVQGLRLPMPTSLRGLWNQPMLCPCSAFFSENRCWIRQAMGKNNLKLSAKGFFLNIAQKPHGRSMSLCWFFFYIRCQAGEADSHPHLPGRPQLQVRFLHHNSAANIFPLIIFAQYSILQVQK